jgi:glutamate dehydrogenase
MSDTTQAAVHRIREESPIVDAVCRQLERQLPDEAELLVSFAEIFLSKASTSFLEGRSADSLTHIVLGAFRFLQRSQGTRVDVESFNPDVENEGWYAPVSVLRTNISERPFVVDSLREFLSTEHLAIEHLVYPVLHVERDEDGRILEIRPSAEGEDRESLVHCEFTRVADETNLEALGAQVRDRLQDVVRVTDDFRPMVDAVNRVVAELVDLGPEVSSRSDEISEIQDFLRWLRDGAFVFLGYRGYDIVGGDEDRAICVEPGSGLGVLRNEADSAYADPVRLSDLGASMRELVETGPMLIISKTNARSTVHRLVRMDYIGIKKLGPDGATVGEHRFIGLFTSRAYQEQAENIPILRHKLQQIIEATGAREGSHDFKEIHTIFNSLPKEELFLTSAEQIGADVQVVLTSYHSEGVRVTVREDPLRRGGSVMVILPKDKFSGEVRKAIEHVLIDQFQAEVLNYHLALGEGDQARLHFHLASKEPLSGVDTSDVEVAVSELIRSWADRVREGLERIRPSDEARRLARVYADSFSAEYKAATHPSDAIDDILELEAMHADGRLAAIAFSETQDPMGTLGDYTELKLYLRIERLILSDFMPILENAGLRVIGVTPHFVGGEAPPAAIFSFSVQDADGRVLDTKGCGSLLASAIMAVRNGDASNDVMNALVVSAGLSWREADVLRAYAAYAFQLGAVPSRLSIPHALVAYPTIAAALFGLFEAKFDPRSFTGMEERRREVAKRRGRLNGLLGEVELLSDDRALRRLVRLIEETVRTNYYRNGGAAPTRISGSVPYLSLKFAMRELSDITRTKLLYEVWVRSSRMEGVHLRGAKVARGGIRYSDRPDDFRTEILGLVNTQMVKNSVIVPAGSKGGFITLAQLPDRETMAEEAREQYETLMRGLLDITDNLDEDGETSPPEDVVSWDDPDPYLVVAADKGTATYSDVANGVAAEYGFWLDDAFASGGSHGYDHKIVGITARGAWESVKRHFAERGKDIQSEPFTVAGIGDMSGDVFGNGMLLSRQIRLIAAFDHRHVFIDPDPDPASSFAERERLFALGRSSWEDYDTSLLSRGGMIVSRGSKSVELSPQAKKALGVEGDVEPIDGESLIRLVLAAPVELLWNGGIGTYVKAPSQNHSDAGDPSNDAVRVDSSDLRCLVVGEGGNLGFTQEARIDFALRGGAINTDALDNSGGVNLSDREVNLKILLGPVVAAGDLSREERNELLDKLTDSVAELVLRDNESQSLAISLDERRAREGVDEFRDLMSAQERQGLLDRVEEGLPTWEVLQDRIESTGHSLSRPELCVLLAYAKLDLMGRLLGSDLPDDPAAEGYVRAYFPTAGAKAAGEEGLKGHRLKRQIVASQLTNDLVDLMGATFVNRVSRDSGVSPDTVVRAWLISSRLANHQEILARLRGGPSEDLGSEAICRWLLGLSRVLERTTRWLLSNMDPDRPTAAVIDENAGPLSALRRDFGDIVTGEDRKIFERRAAEIEGHGAPRELAQTLITLRFLDQLLEILMVARETKTDALSAGRAYYQIAELLQVPWLRHTIFSVAQDDRWEQRAALALVEDLGVAHQRLTVRLVSQGEGMGDSVAERLFGDHSSRLDRLLAIMEDVRAEERVTLSSLSVAVRSLSRLTDQTLGLG